MDRLRSVLVMDLAKLFASAQDINFNKVISNNLMMQPVGSLVANTFYSVGGDETKYQEKDKLSLDVVIWHPEYVASALRDKVLDILRDQTYGDIFLLKKALLLN
jgi:hypothetical protein